MTDGAWRWGALFAGALALAGLGGWLLLALHAPGLPADPPASRPVQVTGPRAGAP